MSNFIDDRYSIKRRALIHTGKYLLDPDRGIEGCVFGVIEGVSSTTVESA
jgi:hypothetical protein